MTDRSTVDFLNDATVGDLVWFYDGHRNRYDAKGKYEGRGVWSLEAIKEETRRSFTLAQCKFDRKTGEAMARNGFTSPHKLCGQKGYEAAIWMAVNAWKLKKAVESCNDIDKLKQIAEIVGYVE